MLRPQTSLVDIAASAPAFKGLAVMSAWVLIWASAVSRAGDNGALGHS